MEFISAIWGFASTIGSDADYCRRRKPLEQIDADALIVLVFEGRKEGRFGAADLAAAGEITGKLWNSRCSTIVPGFAAKRVLVAGAGKPEKFDPAVLRKLKALQYAT